METDVPVDWYTFEGSKYSGDRFTAVWLVALLTYGVGDIVTTIAIAWFSLAHVEANPLIAEAITLFGGGGYLALKLLAFFLAIGISVWAGVQESDPVLFYGPLAILAVVGLGLTLWNAWLLF